MQLPCYHFRPTSDVDSNSHDDEEDASVKVSPITHKNAEETDVCSKQASCNPILGCRHAERMTPLSPTQISPLLFQGRRANKVLTDLLPGGRGQVHLKISNNTTRFGTTVSRWYSHGPVVYRLWYIQGIYNIRPTETPLSKLPRNIHSTRSLAFMITIGGHTR